MKASKKTVVNFDDILTQVTDSKKATSKSDTLTLYNMIEGGNNTYNELLLYTRAQVYARSNNGTTNNDKKLAQFKLDALKGQYNDIATFKVAVESGTFDIDVKNVTAFMKALEKRAKNIIKYALDYIPSETRLTNVWYNEAEYKQVTKYNAKSDSYELIER